MLDAELLFLDEPLGSLDPAGPRRAAGRSGGDLPPARQVGRARHPRSGARPPCSATARAAARRTDRAARLARRSRLPPGLAVRDGVRARAAARRPRRRGHGDAVRPADARLPPWRALLGGLALACRGPPRARRAPASRPTLRIASKAFTESVVLARDRRRARARGGDRRRAPGRPRRLARPVGRAGERRHRRLPRIHRHAARRDLRRPRRGRHPGRGAARPRLVGRQARRARRRHDRAARLQQHLRDRHDRAAGARARRRDDLRPARAPGAALRVQQRVHEPPRRLARAAAAATACRRRTCRGSTMTSPTGRSPAAPSTPPTSTRPTPRSAATACCPLADDLRFFQPLRRHPSLSARPRDARRAGRARQRSSASAGRIDEATMVALNARAKLDRVPQAEVAADFVRANVRRRRHAPRRRARRGRMLRRVGEHLLLVGISLLGGDPARDPAGHRRRQATAPRPGRAGGRRRRADAAHAGAAGVHDPAVRDRRAPRDGGAVPLQPAADRAEHPRRPHRHPDGLRESAEALGLPPGTGCGSSSCRWPAR